MLMLLLIVPFMIYFYLKQRKKSTGSIRFSDLSLIGKIVKQRKPKWRHLLFILRLLSVLFLIVAMAGLRQETTFEEIITHGVDIMLTMDCSGSMQAEDFKPNNRLYVAKEVVRDFVKGRKHDRMGLVVFAGVAFTQCPLTMDYGILEKFIDRLKIGTVSQDGTAIGPAIASSLNRLRDSKAKSKIIILLTDGTENVENLKVNYKEAARLAQSLGVKIYTIGVGKDDEVAMPIDSGIFGRRYTYYKADLNEEGLKEIAEMTGGLYFRATDAESLKEIFGNIDKLEKSEIKVKHYTRYDDLFRWLVTIALILMVTEVVLAHTRFRTLP
jgi:Ca-activated chloride channel family protein